MSKTKTITGTGSANEKYTLTFTGADTLKISGSTFTMKSLFPTITAKITGMYTSGSNTASVSVDLVAKNDSYTYKYYASEKNYSYISWSNGTTKTLVQGSNGSSFDTLRTSSYFNANNATSKTVSVTYKADINCAYNNNYYPTGSWGTTNNSFTLSQTLTLNAPPLIDSTHNTVTAISYDTPYVYAGLTTASVDVGNLSAQYDGTITNIAFKIGSTTVTGTQAGTLSIPLTEVGTFTPTVTFTDSRGQTSTRSLSAITVNGYNAPTVNFTCLRTDSAGVPNDEGQSAVVTAEIGWTSVLTSLTAPTVAVTDIDGNAVATTTTWYSDSALTTAISDWSTLTTSPVTVYGLVDNSGHNAFNTQLSYIISITPNDTQGSGTTITQTLGSAFYTIDFLAGGHGIAFGQPASQTGFVCNMNATFNDDVYIDLPNYQTPGSVDEQIVTAVQTMTSDWSVILES